MAPDADGLTQLGEMMREERVYATRDGGEPADPETRRRRRRKGLFTTAIVTAVVLIASGLYVGWRCVHRSGPPRR
ncbi:MAG: hypothetical protein ACTHKX_00560 [Pseudolysinimonas sp.]